MNRRAVVAIIDVNFRFDLEVNCFHTFEIFGEVFLKPVNPEVRDPSSNPFFSPLSFPWQAGTNLAFAITEAQGLGTKQAPFQMPFIKVLTVA